ncbi:hypothetical protein LWP59_27405 [Amycolatopsis acidiphila]|uniref:Uncharacterized protein n=1 Tax=Amycolatopsis acidiphila TaxID=715473 RepID=A0A558A111_9PSEU|nr:hypothetical protein [Amycolatopsis acidiphila]TVT17942.1 hypothetical protein FNH06_29400 [Amycolatopsis acidiphila]UIJ57844.1 hypothetical protein LWP59_27405 [Amycolatopsis acidiphila]GHG71445.1 hypothetical protein GCM10017788_33390 [Amycolatopsis acidiphila]
MLTKWDDYPIHQTAVPAAELLSSDLGRYERHWLVMHDKGLTTQLGFGLSVHPNRGIVDAAISVSRNGTQQSVFASGRMTRDRDTAVGPLRVDVVEPMRVLRVVLDEHDGMAADLTFTAVSQCIEDSRMRREAAGVLISERTRTVQFGEWSGSLTLDGETFDITRDQWWGFRDRSWGSRTTGTVAESQMGEQHSAIYFAWTLLRFPDECLVVAVNETPDGCGEARTAAALPFLGPDDPAYGNEATITRSDTFQFDIDYLAGTRRPARVDLTVGPRGLLDRRIDIEPRGLFQMQGLGYYHPKWRHGADHGGEVVGVDRWVLADLDPSLKENMHVQQLSRAVRDDGAVGIGLFEHVAIGRHIPSGLPEGLAPPDGRRSGGGVTSSK